MFIFVYKIIHPHTLQQILYYSILMDEDSQHSQPSQYSQSQNSFEETTNTLPMSPPRSPPMSPPRSPPMSPPRSPQQLDLSLLRRFSQPESIPYSPHSPLSSPPSSVRLSPQSQPPQYSPVFTCVKFTPPIRNNPGPPKKSLPTIPMCIDETELLNQSIKPMTVLSIQPFIEPLAIEIYKFIKINNATILYDIEIKCPNPSEYTARANKYAFSSCCGFSAPVMACILYINLLHCNQKGIDLLSGFSTHNFLSLLDYGQPLELKNNGETIIIPNRENLYERIGRFYMLISGYAHFPQDIGWNKRCSTNYTLLPGINLVTIFEYYPNPDSTGKCATFHHFLVYCLEDKDKEYKEDEGLKRTKKRGRDKIEEESYDSIIYDTWAGGCDGYRHAFIRIKKFSDIQDLFDRINKTKDVGKRNDIFLRYFNAPNKLGKFDFPEQVQVGILNGAELDKYFWTYLYGKDVTGNTSKYTQKATQDVLDELYDSSAHNSAHSSAHSSPHNSAMSNSGYGVIKENKQTRRKQTRRKQTKRKQTKRKQTKRKQTKKKTNKKEKKYIDNI